MYSLPWNKGRTFPDCYVPLLLPEPQGACKAIHVRSGVLRGFLITQPETHVFLFEAVSRQPSSWRTLQYHRIRFMRCVSWTHTHTLIGCSRYGFPSSISVLKSSVYFSVPLVLITPPFSGITRWDCGSPGRGSTCSWEIIEAIGILTRFIHLLRTHPSAFKKITYVAVSVCRPPWTGVQVEH